MELIRSWWTARQARNRIRRIKTERIIAELSMLERRIRQLEHVGQLTGTGKKFSELSEANQKIALTNPMFPGGSSNE